MDRRSRSSRRRQVTRLSLAGALLLTCIPLLAGAANAPKKSDRARRLEGMAVIGNQELPKSLYIVPWKQAHMAGGFPPPAPALEADPVTAVDPPMFRRQLQFYDAAQSGHN